MPYTGLYNQSFLQSTLNNHLNNHLNNQRYCLLDWLIANTIITTHTQLPTHDHPIDT